MLDCYQSPYLVKPSEPLSKVLSIVTCPKKCLDFSLVDQFDFQGTSRGYLKLFYRKGLPKWQSWIDQFDLIPGCREKSSASKRATVTVSQYSLKLALLLDSTEMANQIGNPSCQMQPRFERKSLMTQSSELNGPGQMPRKTKPFENLQSWTGFENIKSS